MRGLLRGFNKLHYSQSSTRANMMAVSRFFSGTGTNLKNAWIEMEVTDNVDSIRVDRYLRRYFNPLLTQSQIEKAARQKQLLRKTEDGEVRLKSSDRLRAGDFLMINKRNLPSSNVSNVPSGVAGGREPLSKQEHVDHALVKTIRSAVLYRHRDFLVLNKPYGLPVQGGSGLVSHLDKLLSHAGLHAEGECKPLLVHRLDRDTTGALILARTHTAAGRFHDMFRESTRDERDKHRDVAAGEFSFRRKIYLALLHGSPESNSGEIRLPLEKRVVHGPGAKPTFTPNFELMTPALTETSKTTAVTLYDVLWKRNGLSLVKFRLKTGRTHQLRAHSLYGLDAPIVGDKKYRKKEGVGDDKKFSKLHLHAREISFVYDGEEITVRAPLPEHFINTLVSAGISATSMDVL